MSGTNRAWAIAAVWIAWAASTPFLGAVSMLTAISRAWRHWQSAACSTLEVENER